MSHEDAMRVVAELWGIKIALGFVVGAIAMNWTLRA